MFSLLATVFGSLCSLLPEIIKFLTQKEDNKQELAIMDRQIELAKIQGNQKLEAIEVERDISASRDAYVAFKASIEAGSQKSNIGWIDGVNALVRPVITFGCFMFLGYILYYIMPEFAFSIAEHKLNAKEVLDAISVSVFGELILSIIGWWFGFRGTGKQLSASKN